MVDPVVRVDETDRVLIERSQRGDTESYGRLVERYQHVAFRTAYLVTRSTTDAEDATQEGLVKAYLRIDSFDVTRPFRPWLLTIVANEARNTTRSQGRRLHYESRAARNADSPRVVRSPEHHAVRAATSDALLAAVNRLPEAERLIVGLRYFLELSEAETALVADIPRGTVKSRMARALTRLRNESGVDGD